MFDTKSFNASVNWDEIIRNRKIVYDAERKHQFENDLRFAHEGVRCPSLRQEIYERHKRLYDAFQKP